MLRLVLELARLTRRDLRLLGGTATASVELVVPFGELPTLAETVAHVDRGRVHRLELRDRLDEPCDPVELLLQLGAAGAGVDGGGVLLPRQLDSLRRDPH